MLIHASFLDASSYYVVVQPQPHVLLFIGHPLRRRWHIASTVGILLVIRDVMKPPNTGLPLVSDSIDTK